MGGCAATPDQGSKVDDDRTHPRISQAPHRRRTLPRGRPRRRPRELQFLRQGAARQQGLLRRQGQPGAGDPQAPGRARRLLRRRLGERDRGRCSPPAPRPTASPTATPIKKESEIAAAFRLGVTLFAIDCEAEVEKVARAAPGSRVICRIHCDNAGADWPLSRKFGCEPAYAADILEHRPPAGPRRRTASPSTSAPSRTTWRPGTARSPRPRRSSAPAPSAASTCRWSISAAASRPSTSARRRSSNPTARRSSARCASISATPSRTPSSSPAAGWSAMPA